MTKLDIKNVVRSVPLFGELIDCRIQDHSDAFKEFFTNLVFSAMPIWLGTIVAYVTTASLDKMAIDYMVTTISNGELFIYSNAILAPIFYYALKDERGVPNFPGQYWHVLIVVIIAVICSVMFALQKIDIKIDVGIVFRASVVFYFFSMTLYYLSLVYKNNRFTGANNIRKSAETDFADAFDRRHENA